MKRIGLSVFTFAIALAVVLTLSLPAHAQGADLFKAKCAMCHGADGSGSAMGKKMGAHDFTGAEVQKMSDADLTDTIAKGKNKMPAYADKLKPEEIKGLVAYIRTLKK
jgi:cytochrome c6